MACRCGKGKKSFALELIVEKLEPVKGVLCIETSMKFLLEIK